MQALSVRIAMSGETPLNDLICLQGWVRTRRDSKAGFSFVQLHDGSCFDAIQIVADAELENYDTEVKRLTAGCAIRATGKLVASQGKGQSIEMQASEIEVIGWVDDPDTYPLAAKRHSFEHLRENAHLRPRSNTIGAIARVRNKLSLAIHNYFDQQGFVWVNTPLITASDCEGAGELFRVSTLDRANLPRKENQQIDSSQDFFGRDTYLTVSGQLNVECYCLALSKVYTFGPAFRAENSNTSRHLAEFWMIEPEIAFANLGDNADLAEDLLRSVIAAVMAQCEDDIAFFSKHIDASVFTRLNTVIDSDFERLEYTEAVEILQRSGQSFEFPVTWGADLQSEHERYLTEQHVGRPVIVVNYPKQIKAFYMRLNDDDKTVAAMDVLVPGMGEIVGGSQREERLSVLDGRIEDEQLRKELWWYRDLRRYGTVPHAGFGLGFERLLGYITGMSNVRDVIPFPRTPKSAPF